MRLPIRIFAAFALVELLATGPARADYLFQPTLQSLVDELNHQSPAVLGQPVHYRGGFVEPTRAGVSDAIESMPASQGFFQDSEHPEVLYCLPGHELETFQYDPVKIPFERFIISEGYSDDPASEIFINWLGSDILLGNQFWSSEGRDRPPVVFFTQATSIYIYDSEIDFALIAKNDDVSVTLVNCDVKAPLFFHSVTLDGCRLYDATIYADDITLTGGTLPEPGTLALLVGGAVGLIRRRGK